MSYEVFRYIFIIALILCGVFFLVSAILFFVLNIPKVIRDLSGMTAKKAIKEIREQNEKTGDKSHKVSQINRERGKLTDKISESGRVIKRSTTMQIGYGVETAKIAETPQVAIPSADETSLLDQSGNIVPGYTAANETSVLDVAGSIQPAYPIADETSILDTAGNIQSGYAVAGETSVLDENLTAQLNKTKDETEVLDAPPVHKMGETENLSEKQSLDNTTLLENAYVAAGFAIEFDITLIHTNETIGTEAIV